MEAAPEDLDPQAIGRALVAQPARRRGPRPARVGNHQRLSGALGARARGQPTATATRPGASMEAMLRERFALDHTTLQVDHTGGEPITDPTSSTSQARRRARRRPMS